MFNVHILFSGIFREFRKKILVWKGLMLHIKHIKNFSLILHTVKLHYFLTSFKQYPLKQQYEKQINNKLSYWKPKTSILDIVKSPFSQLVNGVLRNVSHLHERPRFSSWSIWIASPLLKQQVQCSNGPPVLRLASQTSQK